MLDYQNKQAPHERTIIANCYREGRPVPRNIASAPELEPDNVFYFRAFDELITTRNFEMGPIPYYRINDYCDEYELTHTEREEMRYVIAAVDGWHIERINEAREKAAKRGGRKRR